MFLICPRVNKKDCEPRLEATHKTFAEERCQALGHHQLVRIGQSFSWMEGQGQTRTANSNKIMRFYSS